MNNEQPAPAAIAPDTAPEFSGRATYAPEDNKLRLYVGRVPRDEFLKLRAEGWTTLHKQREAGGGDFVAIWTPDRRDTALEYAGIIEDEDMGPEERAADRAERFGGYRDKRAGEATDRADAFDAGPSAHGFQSQARAERSARRHDRIAARACDAWSKAEYWQQRTAGVIGHALHKSSPGVRMGRIKDLEAAIRKSEKEFEDRARNWRNWQKLAAITDPAKQTEAVRNYVGSTNQWSEYPHPRPENASRYHQENKASIYSLITAEQDPISGAEACALFFSDHREPQIENDEWLTHYRLRLAYENQMLEAQGGRAAFVEMAAGGFIGKHQIQKVNKSAATGRVVSVNVLAPTGANFDRKGQPYGPDNPRPLTVHTVNVERMASESYRAPTPEELAAFEAKKRADKAAQPKVDPCPLINPTDADAERLQTLWNNRAKAIRSRSDRERYGSAFIPSSVLRVTQAQYSANSKGSFARLETRELCADAEMVADSGNMYCRETRAHNERIGKPVCKVRVGPSSGDQWPYPKRVVIITDKPQKPLPTAVWEPIASAAPAPVPTKAEQTAFALT